jgi:uncharacterized membrane protein (DUF485 family)
MQTKTKSIIEAISNTFIGMAVSFAIQLVIYPTMGIPVRISQNIIITIVFTVASIVRSYIVRRIFNKIN